MRYTARAYYRRHLAMRMQAEREAQLRLANLQKIARVAASLPHQRRASVDGAPYKHEAASPARATASTTYAYAGDDGGCSAHGKS